eukprot:m.212809 g.212809  ORF g.212809 m.212809 type:complete len:99 (-) comp22156_c0_seq4:21-317(-)
MLFPKNSCYMRYLRETCLFGCSVDHNFLTGTFFPQHPFSQGKISEATYLRLMEMELQQKERQEKEKKIARLEQLLQDPSLSSARREKLESKLDELLFA